MSTPIRKNQYGDDIYSTPNGEKTGTQIMQELHAAGWDGKGGDPVNVYNDTAAAGKSSNAPSSPPVSQQQPQQQMGTPGWAQDVINAGKASSGFSIQDLEEKKRQFDLTLQHQKDMWTQQGLPQLVIQQRAQQLAEDEFHAQNDLAQKNLALQQAGVSGTYNGAPTEQAREFNANNELQRGNLGLDYLKTASSMGGPADYFQQSNFLRGASSDSGVPVFLKALRDNVVAPGLTATPGDQSPTVQSADNLATRMTGGAAVPSTGTNPGSALSTIQQIGARGGQALSPQALEQLTPDEQALLQSGLKASGFSMPSFLSAYQQSRVGQGSAQAA